MSDVFRLQGEFSAAPAVYELAVMITYSKNGQPRAMAGFQTIKPFQVYTLRFRLDATDAHWNYMRFEFMAGDKVCAAGYMKGAAVARGVAVYMAVTMPFYCLSAYFVTFSERTLGRIFGMFSKKGLY